MEKHGVIIAQPEVCHFTIEPDYHDFLVLGCSGIFEKLETQDVLEVIWNQVRDKKQTNLYHPSMIHKLIGKCADEVLQEAARRKSRENLTVAILVFKNLDNFCSERSDRKD